MAVLEAWFRVEADFGHRGPVVEALREQNTDLLEDSPAELGARSPDNLREAAVELAEAAGETSVRWTDEDGNEYTPKPVTFRSSFENGSTGSFVSGTSPVYEVDDTEQTTSQSTLLADGGDDQ